MKTLQFNLILAWVWIWLGFLSGLGLGLFFHKENWLGGYGSFKRRLYRLCHISFFGLGLLNLCFYLTALVSGLNGVALSFAAWAFIVGAVSMPSCCLVMAHFPRAHSVFALPVGSLLLGGTLTLVAVVQANPETRAVVPASRQPAMSPPQTLRGEDAVAPKRLHQGALSGPAVHVFPTVKPSLAWEHLRVGIAQPENPTSENSFIL